MLLTVDQVRTKLLEMGVDQRILDRLEDPIQLRAVYSHERMHGLIQQRMIEEFEDRFSIEEFRENCRLLQQEVGLGAEHSYEILLGICADN